MIGPGGVFIVDNTTWPRSRSTAAGFTEAMPIDAIRVGTIKRVKGLEFKQALIPDIRREHTLTRPPAQDTERERWDLTRRELCVAMTRARGRARVGGGIST